MGGWLAGCLCRLLAEVGAQDVQVVTGCRRRVGQWVGVDEEAMDIGQWTGVSPPGGLATTVGLQGLFGAGKFHTLQRACPESKPGMLQANAASRVR